MEKSKNGFFWSVFQEWSEGECEGLIRFILFSSTLKSWGKKREYKPNKGPSCGGKRECVSCSSLCPSFLPWCGHKKESSRTAWSLVHLHRMLSVLLELKLGVVLCHISVRLRLSDSFCHSLITGNVDRTTTQLPPSRTDYTCHGVKSCRESLKVCVLEKTIRTTHLSFSLYSSPLTALRPLSRLHARSRRRYKESRQNESFGARIL